MERHYSYDNQEEFSNWLGENRRKTVEQVLELGKLAKTVLKKRQEIVGEYPELEQTGEELEKAMEDRLKSARKYSKLKKEFPEKAEERKVVAREWKKSKENQERLLEKYRHLYPKTVGINNREALKDLGVEFNDKQSTRALLNTMTLLGIDEMEEVIAYALRYFPKTWLKHINVMVEVGGGEGSEGYVDRDYKDGAYILSAAGEITVVLHELAHLVEYQNRYIGRLERDFLLWLEEEEGIKLEDDYYYVSEKLISNISASIKDKTIEKTKELDEEDKEKKYSEHIVSTGEIIGYSYEVLTYGLQALFSAHYPKYSFRYTERDAEVHEEFILGLLLLESRD